MANRILWGDSYDPWHNLAVEALVYQTLTPGDVVLYLWQNANTVVIGRHQNAWRECRVKLLEDEGGRLARRSTGGGAVFHDLGNLNFSFVLSREDYDVRRQLEVIRRAVAEFGIDAEFSGRNDLLAAGAKFSGNAFKLSEHVALHHGTLLVNVDMRKLGRYLSPDEEKLRGKGIKSVRSRVVNLADFNDNISIEGLKGALTRAFIAEYGGASALSMDELDKERLNILEAQYASWDFRLGKSLPFDVRLSHRFDWGGVALEIRLENGRVTAVKTWSDAMDDAMIDRISPALMNTPYDNDALSRALMSLQHPQIQDLAQWIKKAPLS